MRQAVLFTVLLAECLGSFSKTCLVKTRLLNILFLMGSGNDEAASILELSSDGFTSLDEDGNDNEDDESYIGDVTKHNGGSYAVNIGSRDDAAPANDEDLQETIRTMARNCHETKQMLYIPVSKRQKPRSTDARIRNFSQT
jgi:hypothetical protein